MKFFIALFFVIGTATGAQAAPLPPQVVQELNKAQIPTSAVGIVVREVNARAPLLAVNAAAPMNPASTMKLLTTYAGLELLGPAYTWKTEAWLDGKLEQGVLQGDLVLKGYGDPKFTIEQFWLWLRELRARGLREIRGDLVLDRSYFELPAHDPAAFDNDPVRAYNVGPDALLLNFNTLRLRYLPDGSTMKVISEPDLAGVTLDNRLVSQAVRGPAKNGCDNWDDAIRVQPDGDSVILQGDYPSDCGEREQNLSVMPHARYVAALFRTLWQELGGTLQGGVREGAAGAGAQLFSTHQSMPLAEVIRDINKFSNNVMARQLFLTLGTAGGTNGHGKTATPENERSEVSSLRPNETRHARFPLSNFPPQAGERANESLREFHVNASLPRSIVATQDWLRRKGLDFPELVLENGAGLSRAERISPQHLAQLLQSVAASPLSAELVASLPILGVDGSAKKRLKDSPAASHAHLKTGTLEGVKTIAGYVRSQSGREWILVFFINHPNAKLGQPAQDALIEWVRQRR